VFAVLKLCDTYVIASDVIELLTIWRYTNFSSFYSALLALCRVLCAMQVEDYSAHVEQVGGIGNSYNVYVIELVVRPN